MSNPDDDELVLKVAAKRSSEAVASRSSSNSSSNSHAEEEEEKEEIGPLVVAGAQAVGPDSSVVQRERRKHQPAAAAAVEPTRSRATLPSNRRRRSTTTNSANSTSRTNDAELMKVVRHRAAAATNSVGSSQEDEAPIIVTESEPKTKDKSMEFLPQDNDKSSEFVSPPPMPVLRRSQPIAIGRGASQPGAVPVAGHNHHNDPSNQNRTTPNQNNTPDEHELSTPLIEATVVQEQEVFLAEPIVSAHLQREEDPPGDELDRSVDHYQDEGQPQPESPQDNKPTQRGWHPRRCWVILALVLLLMVGVGTLIWIVSSRSSDSDSNTSSKTANPILWVSSQPSMAPSSRPSLRPTATTPALDSSGNIFDHTTNTTSQGNATILPTLAPSNTNTTTEPLVPYSWLKIDWLPQYTLQAIAKNTESPQGQSVRWVQNHPQFFRMPTWRKQQLMALATLYYTTGGGQKWEPPPIYEYWLNDTINECAWYGTDKAFQPNCTAAGQYQYLHVGGDGLRNQLPPELALLTRLNSIILRYNALTGRIPTQLGALTQLTHLTLGGNAFTGRIPSELGALTKLTLLVLRGNQLTGK